MTVSPSLSNTMNRRLRRADELRRGDAHQLAERLVEPFLGHAWVQPREGLAEPTFEDDLLVARALGGRLAEGDLGPVNNAVAQIAEPLQRGVFDNRLGETVAHSFHPPSPHRSWMARASPSPVSAEFCSPRSFRRFRTV